MPEWITRYWIEWLFGLFAAGLLLIVKTMNSKLKKAQSENEALRNGMRSLLKAQIVQSCEKAIKDGWCGARLRDTINDLYLSYHALGGNGTATSMVEQALKLPAVEPERGERT